MKKVRHTDSQILAILKQSEAVGAGVKARLFAAV